jgi:hypothetical protein
MNNKKVLQNQKNLNKLNQHNWQECSNCGERKPDVMLQTNPYSVEMDGDYTECLLCDECYDDFAGGI